MKSKKLKKEKSTIPGVETYRDFVSVFCAFVNIYLNDREEFMRYIHKDSEGNEQIQFPDYMEMKNKNIETR